MKRSVWSRNFFPVVLTYFIDTFGLSIVYPIFTPLFLRPHRHLLISETLFERTILLGLLIATFPLAQFFCSPILGSLSDRVGRKKVLILTVSGGIFGYFLTGTGVYLRNLPVLWIGRALTGLFAANLTLCLAAIADISKDKEERTKNFSWIGMIGGFGFILAIIVGGSLSDPDIDTLFRPDIPFYITSFLSCINLFLLCKYFEESFEDKPHDKIDFLESVKNIGVVLKTTGVRKIYFVYFLYRISWITSMQFLSTYLIEVYHVSVKVITFTFTMIGITWAISNFLINKFLARIIAPGKTFDLSLFTLSIFFYLILIPHEPLTLSLIHFFLATFASALAWTNGLATISLSASKMFQGSILGINKSIVSLATIIGPLVGGMIAGINIYALYAFTATCSLLAAILMFIPSFRIKKS